MTVPFNTRSRLVARAILGLLCATGLAVSVFASGCQSDARSSSARDRAVSSSAGTASTDTTEPPSDAQWITLGGVSAQVWASSALAPQDGNTYGAAQAFDGDRTTAWVEGVRGVGDALDAADKDREDAMYQYLHASPDRVGQGQSLSIQFEKPVTLVGVAVVPGYTKSSSALVNNAVPRRIEISADGDLVGRYYMRYESALETTVEGSARRVASLCYPLASSTNLSSTQVIVFDAPVETTSPTASAPPSPTSTTTRSTAPSSSPCSCTSAPSRTMLTTTACSAIRGCSATCRLTRPPAESPTPTSPPQAQPIRSAWRTATRA